MSSEKDKTAIIDTSVVDAAEDQAWADLLSPARRKVIRDTGLAVGAFALAGLATPLLAQTAPAAAGTAPRPLRKPGESPWGYDTYKEPTPRPAGYRPGEDPLPTKPRAYTDIKSYHAHIYFDEDTYEKAALLRRWAAERFNVELGHWNAKPFGPHVTPSFYFGFKNEQLIQLIPWLQLNSLGLTILVHPNTGDSRSDHIYYTAWINRSQAVNAYNIPTPEQLKAQGKTPVAETIYPNTKPTIKLET